jgi:hypothetical protein
MLVDTKIRRTVKDFEIPSSAPRAEDRLPCPCGKRVFTFGARLRGDLIQPFLADYGIVLREIFNQNPWWAQYKTGGRFRPI